MQARRRSGGTGKPIEALADQPLTRQAVCYRRFSVGRSSSTSSFNSLNPYRGFLPIQELKSMIEFVAPRPCLGRSYPPHLIPSHYSRISEICCV